MGRHSPRMVRDESGLGVSAIRIQSPVSTMGSHIHLSLHLRRRVSRKLFLASHLQQRRSRVAVKREIDPTPMTWNSRNDRPTPG